MYTGVLTGDSGAATTTLSGNAEGEVVVVEGTKINLASTLDSQGSVATTCCVS
jgi:hypothetical protein